MLSDFHIPDHNVKLVKLINKFISDLKPDKVHILGDFLNFTAISSFLKDPYYHTTIQEELDDGKDVLSDIVKSAKKAKIIFYEGNHEARMIKYLSKNALDIAELAINGDKIISLPHLLQLKELGIKFYSYNEVHIENKVAFTHGDRVRIKAGFTANAMLDRYGMSGVSGHTHRLSLITRNQFGNGMFWIENGCMANLQPTPAYMYNPDWTNGFSVITFSGGKVYPQVVKVVDESFIYNGKVYQL